MKIYFVSLVVESKAWHESQIGKEASHHAHFGVVFSNKEEAEEHQKTLLSEKRDGVMIAKSGTFLL